MGTEQPPEGGDSQYLRNAVAVPSGPFDRLREQLPKIPLFHGVPANSLAHAINHMEWFSLPGGWSLLRRGEYGNAIYVITAGSIGMWLEDEKGEDYLAGQFVAGQAVGEMSLLAGGPRTATLKALRDTEVIRIARPVFDMLAARFPIIMRNLATQLAHRLKDVTLGRRDPATQANVPKTIALIPATPGVPHEDVCRQLAEGFKKQNLSVALLDSTVTDSSSEWFHAMETKHDLILYSCQDNPDNWTRQALRQADRVLLLVNADRSPATLRPIEETLRVGPRRYLELAILHKPGRTPAYSTSDWLRRLRPEFHYNLELGAREDIDRLVRHMLGRAVGLVLAGGGARGFAHLGVLRALKEAAIPVDLLGGTSMGGIVAAGIACGWSLDELKERMHKSFVETNPLNDFTFPNFAFLRGRKVGQLLHENFGEARIEDQRRTYFCVSANLTRGRQLIHRTGLVWRALRASVALPGILPPVVWFGDLLVDGAVMNNFPVTIMTEYNRGPVIGVDVEDHEAFAAPKDQKWRTPVFGILGEGPKGGPGIVRLLMRSGTVNSEMQTNIARRRADLLFEPELGPVGVRDFDTFDDVIEAGYQHAIERLGTADLSLFKTGG